MKSKLIAVQISDDYEIKVTGLDLESSEIIAVLANAYVMSCRRCNFKNEDIREVLNSVLNVREE